MATFDELETRVKNWAENEGTEFDTEFDTMVENAENRLSRELNAEAMLIHKTATLTVGQAFLDKPLDGVNIRSLSFIDGSDSNKRKYLEFRTVTYLGDYHPVRAAVGTPRYYANWDEKTWLLAPAANAQDVIEAYYEARITGLSDTVTTTWISVNYPDLLFYAILIEAGCFEKNAEMAGKYSQLYRTALTSAQAEIARIRGDDTSIYPSPTETPLDDDQDEAA